MWFKKGSNKGKSKTTKIKQVGCRGGQDLTFFQAMFSSEIPPAKNRRVILSGKQVKK